MRMPRPPPPAMALIMTAPPAPSDARKALASSRLVGPLVPSMMGTPHLFASALACALSPNRSSASGDGPTKTMLSSMQRRASVAFSLRKP